MVWFAREEVAGVRQGFGRFRAPLVLLRRHTQRVIAAKMSPFVRDL